MHYQQVSEVKQKERDCLEKNARQVAEEIATMVDDEPGPAGDFVKCYVTTCKKYQFFFQQKVSDAIRSSHDRGQETPGPGLELLQEDIFI